MYDEKLASKFRDTIFNIYQTADQVLDKALQKADKDTIIMAMSDHGFCPFRRQININSWLKENGYHKLIRENKQGEDSLFVNTDWSKTKAYALGLNGVYINQRGRESRGIVSSGVEKDNLVHEIVRKLEKYQDPQTGKKVILKAFKANEVYSGSHMSYSPDIILGFNSGYRISWASPLGRLPRKIVEDNMDKWSGDHCMAPQLIPGILLANRKIKKTNPALYDLTPTMLKVFGLPIPKEMVGTSVF
jgi:predicted AlkP superfamily phosphohydrolase/phosphomutase